MPTVSSHYGIAGPVPFVDVETDVDNRLYVDPHAIRLRGAPQPFTDGALRCIDTFFNEVTGSVIAGTPASHAYGQRLLQHFVEPWETRLGMAAEGFHGHGGAETVGSWIWNTLVSDVEALVRVSVLRQLEDLALFVDGVDRDITSDVTTRIIYGPLAKFTESMMNAYPQFTAGHHEVRVYGKQVWNPVDRIWDREQVALPVVDGKPLLLVPKGWARPTLLMSAGRFYETSVLSFAQLEQAVLASNGKLIKTPKDRLKKQAGLGRGRITNLRVTMRAFENEQDLLASFKAFVAARFPDTEAGGAVA
ncbi:hypothetical protein ACFFGH_22060 [Lysobacter korlensis]|uniref:Uncharacterized protein n=1 Tax=Lysobacter korlensis TaxID=553636 RepID=A0ABV6RU67_9GAMM